MLEYTPIKDIPSIVQNLHEQFESGIQSINIISFTFSFCLYEYAV